MAPVWAAGARRVDHPTRLRAVAPQAQQRSRVVHGRVPSRAGVTGKRAGTNLAGLLLARRRGHRPRRESSSAGPLTSTQPGGRHGWLVADAPGAHAASKIDFHATRSSSRAVGENDPTFTKPKHHHVRTIALTAREKRLRRCRTSRSSVHDDPRTHSARRRGRTTGTGYAQPPVSATSTVPRDPTFRRYAERAARRARHALHFGHQRGELSAAVRPGAAIAREKIREAFRQRPCR